MTRAKKAFLTSMTSGLHQIIAIICGFILPRLFLSYYGSSVNGLVSSITQFLGFISLAELGVGAVVQSSLYKPLAEKNTDQISKIFKSANHFFNIIGFILLIYTIGLMFIYPMIVIETYDYLYTALLILIISFSTFSQYYLGITYRMILGADQYGFISQILSCAALVLNTALCFVFIRMSFSVHFVKCTSSIIFLIQPLVLMYIGKKKYKINRKVIIEQEPIKQKWNGVAQHIASVVNNNTDVLVLTLFSDLKTVSVYSVYHLVVNGVKNIVNSFTSGFIALFGNMLAKNERDVLNRTFTYFEWVIHTVTTIAFSLTGVLLLPFVKIYTSGINDVNYIVPSFAVLITAAQAAYCLRLPYNIMTMAAGHYKQTQTSAIVEALLNIIVSVLFVFKYGLIGVAIGTLSAMIYRTIYLAVYISKNIINRKMSHFIKHIGIDVLTALFIGIISLFINIDANAIPSWIFSALIWTLICLFVSLIINYIFYHDLVISFIKKLFKRKDRLI